MLTAKPTTLAELAKHIASSYPDFESFHGKLFSFIPPSEKDVSGFLNELKLSREAFPNKHPCALLVGDLGSIVSHTASLVPATSGDKLLVQYKIDAANLPKCTYLAFVSPFSKIDGTSSYSLAFESINFARAFLSLFFGKLIFYSHIADFDFDLEGKVSLPSPIFRMPLYADFFKSFDSQLCAEIVSRLSLQLADYRLRLQRACNFISNAMNQTDEGFRFASYWIALEVLVGSTDDAIRAALMTAYGYRNKKQVDEQLLFNRISSARHDLIHKGTFGVLPSYFERLMQLYFWDIVLFQLNLPRRGLAELLVGSGMVENEVNRAASSFETPAARAPQDEGG
jgi:hypothetical protein